jgi:hypothetical protein
MKLIKDIKKENPPKFGIMELTRNQKTKKGGFSYA